MFCKNCGMEINAGSAFCQGCGTQVENRTDGNNIVEPLNEQAPPLAAPVFAATQPAPQAPVAVAYVPKKKRHIGRWIFLFLVVLLIGAGIFMYGSIAWFGPKDLGVRYTQKDYNNTIQKLGIHIKADLGNGESYDNADILAGSDTATGYKSANNSATLKIKDLDYNNFNWEFSNFQRKKVQLSDVEATAFFNEIAPAFWWFKNTQVKIASDGSIITSSTANIKKMKQNLFSDVANKIPVPLPDSVNLYTEGNFAVTNNKINMTPKVMNAGVIGLPDAYKSGNNLSVFSGYLERFFTVMNDAAKPTEPKFEIYSAGVVNGQFVFDGNIPTVVEVTPKN